MKLKLKATIKKVADHWDPLEPTDTVEGLVTFYTSEDENLDRTFKNAAEVYEYYWDSENWPEFWDDGPIDDYQQIPKNWKVKLIDTDDPRWKPSDGYEVEILIYGDLYEYSEYDSDIEWNYDDAEIYRISPHIPED